MTRGRRRAVARRVSLRLATIALGCLVLTSVPLGTAQAITLVPNPDTYTVRHDRTRTVAAPGVLANDLGLLGGSTAVLATDVAHGTLSLQANGGFTYKPDPGYVGSDSFTYRARDGILVSLVAATVTITVTNAAPVAVDDQYNAATGVEKTIPAPGVLGNDTDADGDQLLAEAVDEGGNGSLDVHADGSFTFKSGGSFVGVRTFTYRVFDGLVWSAAATVTINVGSNPVPTPTPPPTPPPAPTPTPAPTLPIPLPTLPIPLPTLPIPLPTIDLPLPTIRPPLPTLRPPLPTPTATPAPTSSPGPTPSAPAATPTSPGASPDPSGPAPSDDGNAGPTPTDPTPGSGINIPPIDPFAPVDGVGTIDLGGFEWAVPSLVLSVPGLLLILAVIAQTGAGLASLPFVRSSLGGVGAGGRRRRRVRSTR